MKVESLRFIKTIFEAKYEASLLYHDKRKELFQGLTEKFPAVGLGSNTIEVRNQTKQFKLFAEWNRAGSSMEDVTNFANFRDETHNFLTKLCEVFEIRRMKRIGVRFFYLLPSRESYYDLKKHLARICYQERIIKAWGDEYDDMALVLVYKDRDNFYHLRLGAVEGEEVIEKCGLEYDIDDVPERAILFDIDYYNMVPEIPWAQKFINQANKFVEPKTKEFIKLLEG